MLFRSKDNQISNSLKTEITGHEKGKMYPTDIGIVVNDFLVDNFPQIMDYSFTAEVEKEFDNIATGLKPWNEMIKGFYKPFHDQVEYTLEHSERASGERALGTEPNTGEPVIARIGRFGPMIQIGETSDDGPKPKFASLQGDMTLSSVTLEEALDLFKLPRTLGEFEEKVVSAAIGRFGPYIRHNNAFVSIPKEEDPLTITLERGIELIEAKRKADKDKIIKLFDEAPEVQILNGRWGPFLKIGKKNYKIPKDKDAKSLTLEDCKAIEKEGPTKKTKSKKKK